MLGFWFLAGVVVVVLVVESPGWREPRDSTTTTRTTTSTTVQQSSQASVLRVTVPSRVLDFRRPARYNDLVWEAGRREQLQEVTRCVSGC